MHCWYLWSRTICGLVSRKDSRELTWCDTNSLGKIGRLDTYQLKKRQYGINGDTGPGLDSDMRDRVKFLIKLMDFVQPRSITILGTCKMPVVAYSDASFPTIIDEAEGPDTPRLGWVVSTMD